MREQQACRSSPERLAEPERENPVQAETLPKMRTFSGKVKGMSTTACNLYCRMNCDNDAPWEIERQ